MIPINGPVFSYPEFTNWMEQLLLDDRTSGPIQSAARIGFTALNYKRMLRIDKTLQLLPEAVKSVRNSPPQSWYLITEAWCGDSAQNLPVIARLADLSDGKITLRIFLRDENPEWIARYHTNGAAAIPKLISVDNSGDELFTWGPRPAPAQEIMLDWKKNPRGRSWHEAETELHTWYAFNKGQLIQREISGLLDGTGSKLSLATRVDLDEIDVPGHVRFMN